jgi:hypothetical protein
LLLQCAYRQHIARTVFRIRLGLHRLSQSANVVQAVYRGHAVRNRLREQRMREWLELETFSCCAIQATFRGHRVRRSLAHVRARWAVEQRLRKIVLLQVTLLCKYWLCLPRTSQSSHISSFSLFGAVMRRVAERGKRRCTRRWRWTSTPRLNCNRYFGDIELECMSAPHGCSESWTACSVLLPGCRGRGAATATAASHAICGPCLRFICSSTAPCKCSVSFVGTWGD